MVSTFITWSLEKILNSWFNSWHSWYIGRKLCD